MEDPTEARYQALPQSAEVQAQEEDAELFLPAPETVVDRSVWWIHFIFGCAVLLPWNGEHSVYMSCPRYLRDNF